jgi:hypothetical protein
VKEIFTHCDSKMEKLGLTNEHVIYTHSHDGNRSRGWTLLQKGQYYVLGVVEDHQLLSLYGNKDYVDVYKTSGSLLAELRDNIRDKEMFDGDWIKFCHDVIKEMT